MTILGDPEESSRHQNYSAFDTNGTPDAIQAVTPSKTELKRREEFKKLLFIYDNKLRSGALLAEWNIKRLQQVICPAFTNSIFRLGGLEGVIFLLLDF